MLLDAVVIASLLIADPLNAKSLQEDLKSVEPFNEAKTLMPATIEIVEVPNALSDETVALKDKDSTADFRKDAHALTLFSPKTEHMLLQEEGVGGELQRK